MTFAEIREEVKACGLDHLPDSRVNRLIDLAYRRTYNKELWPWRLTTVSGASPITAPGTIRNVTIIEGDSSESSLEFAQVEDILATGVPAGTPGEATNWFFSALGEVSAFPSPTEEVKVYYYKKSGEWADEDNPDIPDDYHYLIVLDAVRRGKSENGEAEAAAQYAGDYNELLADLKRDAFNQHVSGGTTRNELYEGV